MKIQKDFELLPHTADIKIRAYGDSLANLFTHALIGMFNVIEPRIAGSEHKNNQLISKSPIIERTIEISSLDRESLLVDFLSRALYLSDTYNETYLDAKIEQITDVYVRATIYGLKVNGFAVELKAVTYHDLAIVSDEGVLQTELVFDI